MDTNTLFVKCLFENCNAKLPSIRQLLFHMRLVHPFDKNCQLRCYIESCEKVYSTCDNYRKHVEREHRSELDLLDSHQFSLWENVQVVGTQMNLLTALKWIQLPKIQMTSVMLCRC